MSFSGFSEEDIRKLSRGHDINKQKGAHKPPPRKVTFKPNHTTSRIKNSHNNNANLNAASTQELPDNAKLSLSNKPNGVINNINKSFPKRENAEEKIEKAVDESPTEEKVESAKIDKSIDESIEKVESVKEEKKFKDLDEFESRQKLIEEQNRKRKELLAKALADRTKRTQEEAQRLNEIQEEFKKLDAVLSGDVKILRKQIELASIEYMECQKRYDRIEKEFLEAKLLLHQKQEKKELLTEHLCTIIEKNEERKAEKLNELLKKLQLTPTEINENEAENSVKDNTVEITK